MFNFNVFRAGIRLHENLRSSEIDSPYVEPYINYTMSVAHHIPIRTIIIGQNPYPQDIYPIYGAAFAYDEEKTRGEPPVTVRNLASDLWLQKKVPYDHTIRCFRDSWFLLQHGVLLINESVYAALLGRQTNTLSLREAGYQLQWLEVILTESYFEGVESFLCIAMGNRAIQMASVLRPWCPGELFRMKTLLCINPAARQRDCGSQGFTLDNAPVSQALALIVSQYIASSSTMSSITSHRLKEAQSTLSGVKSVLDESSITLDREAKSFADRVKTALNVKKKGGTIDEEEMLDLMLTVYRTMTECMTSFKGATAGTLIALTAMSKEVNLSQGDRNLLNQTASGFSPEMISVPPVLRPKKKKKKELHDVEEEPEEEAPKKTKKSSRKGSEYGEDRFGRAPSTYTASIAPPKDDRAKEPPTEGRTREESIVAAIAKYVEEKEPASNVPAFLDHAISEKQHDMNDYAKGTFKMVAKQLKTDSAFDIHKELARSGSSTVKWVKKNLLSDE